MMRRAAIAVLVLPLLAGCTTAAEPPGPTPPIPITERDVLLTCPDIPTRHLDVDADDIETIYRCTVEIEDVQGKPTKVQRVLRLESDWAPVLDAYAAPNIGDPADEPCASLVAVDPLILWLDLGDETIAVYAPLDDCGFPQAAAADAIAAAEFDTILVGGEPAE